MNDLLDFLKSADNIQTLFIFFIPGFISLLVAGMIGPVPDDDFSKRVVAAVGYSAMNYAGMGVCTWAFESIGFAGAKPYVQAVFVFVLPFFYPFAIYRLRERQFFGFSTPFPSTWDQFFARRGHTYFVRARLKGTTTEYVLAYYGKNSMASQSPADQMLFVERVYDADADGNWIVRKDTAGLLLPMSECTSIEFIIPGVHADE